jgi:hypothetical protein
VGNGGHECVRLMLRAMCRPLNGVHGDAVNTTEPSSRVKPAATSWHHFGRNSGFPVSGSSTTIPRDGRFASLINSEHLVTMPEIQQPVVLLIGECESPQFRLAVKAECAKKLSDGSSSDLIGKGGSDVVAATPAASQTHRARSIREAVSLLENGKLVPDLVISYQSIPDEFSAADIDHLIGLLPLSRFVVAFSPWCESIGRTEQRWPSAWSVPLAHAAARIRFELQQLSVDQPPLLATTSRDEAFATLAAGSLKRAEQVGQGMTARVVSADASLKECYEHILSSVGFNLDETELPDLLVVAAAFVDENQFRRVKEMYEEDAWSRGFATNSNEAILLVASDMATPDDRKRLLEAGATATISQLRFAEDVAGYFSDPQCHAPV